MAQSAILTSIENVKWWFDNLPFDDRRWKLYHGHIDNMALRSKLFMESKKSVEPEEAWDMLRQALEVSSQNGGKYTLYVPISDRANHGPNAKINLNQVQRGNSSIGGIPEGYVSSTEMERRLMEQKQKIELERRIEDLEAASQANLSWHEMAQDWLFNQGGAEMLVPHVGPVISGLFPGLKGLGTIAQPQQQQAPTEDEPQGQAAADENPELELLEGIRAMFQTDEEYLQAVKGIKEKIKHNPSALFPILQNMNNG